MKRYSPKEIEAKWQKAWEEKGIYRASEDPKKPKRYVLEYFPYPSGVAMHVGHVRNYTIGDAISRFMRMNGLNVLHPMGWDGFGLPAENYAIKNKLSPQKAIKQNTDRFRKQLMQMGFSYDWSREIDSTDPNYYKWTQWFFLLLFKRGLAYQQESRQWWCPVDKTVLANEQVENGKCWRCGNDVEKKALKQWFFKITEYADKLEKDLDDVNWSEGIKTMQRNWIGKSKGVEIDFPVERGIEHFVLLHGKGGASTRNFFPWLKKQLEARGYTVEVPDMPDSDEPDDEKQTEFVLKNCRLDEKTAVIGHSFGGIVALRLLERGNKLAKVILAATPHRGTFLDGKTRPTVAAAIEKGFDFKSIKQNCRDIVALYDSEDYVVAVSDGEEFAEELASPLVIAKGNEGHFCGSEEPEILNSAIDTIRVFTTRPDTLFGATFMVLAPEHPLVGKLTTESQKSKVTSYIKAATAKSDIERQETEREKTGVFTGAYAVNPVNGEKIPIWVADYVLYGYGTGAIMAVPAHDERDWAFAKKFDLPIVHVYDQKGSDAKGCYAGEGVMKNSGIYDGQSTSDAREKIVADLAKKGKAKEKVNYKIRDWLISRQRYWGAPIPIIHCPKDGAVAVPKRDLPVKLPEIKSYEPSGDGRSPLARVSEFVNTACPQCGGKAERETDTMDGFACSSWYFLRFADPHNDKQAFDKDKAEFWLPVDDYIGGAEHAVMHLLYARFWTKVMFDEGLVSFQEPFTTLRNQGMILAPDGQKMSKSKGNTIEPDELLEQGYGADSIRIMELFIGPWNQSANWSVEGMGGAFRFLQRVWTLVQEYLDTAHNTQSTTDHPNKEAERVIAATTKRVTEDVRELGFNTAIAALMECVNELYKIKADSGFSGGVWRGTLSTLLQLLAPFAPHITEELWHQLGHKQSIHTSEWPKWDEKLLISDLMTIVVQVNGKVRANIEVSTDADESEVTNVAQADANAARYLKGKTVKKVIYISGRLINYVV